MIWLNKLFNSNPGKYSKTTNKNTPGYLDGYDAFKLGKIIIDNIRLEGCHRDLGKAK